MGYSKSMILWSETDSRWELQNLIGEEIVAFKNSNEFPIGVNQWNFINNSCKGIKSSNK